MNRGDAEIFTGHGEMTSNLVKHATRADDECSGADFSVATRGLKKAPARNADCRNDNPDGPDR